MSVEPRAGLPDALNTGSPLEHVPTPAGRLGSGVQWLDIILRGGFPENRVFLVVGDPGTGKTTLGLQFLLEGKANGERCLFVALAESRDEIQGVASSHGMDLSGIDIYEVATSEERAKPEEDYTVLHPAEIELGEQLHRLIATVERLRPRRVVIDSLAELRYMAREPVRYRRQMVALKHFLMQQGCTTLVIDIAAQAEGHNPLETIAHGVISFERSAPEYGRERRRMQVLKMRAVDFLTGYHDFTIRTGGLVVWPRLVAGDHRPRTDRRRVASGVAELDAMLAGGPSQGTTMLLVGPSGTGKSTLSQQYCYAATARGDYCAWFTFDERAETIFNRGEALGMNLRQEAQKGMLALEQVDPGTLSPGEFMQRVRRHVEKFNARIIVIDSLNGYLNAMPGERYLLIQMHELLNYLSQMGVLTILVIAQPGILSGSLEPPMDMSYLADSTILLRYFEHQGEVRRSLSVVKMREQNHEKTIREFSIDTKGIRVGQPLREFQGVLTGEPQYVGPRHTLMTSGTMPS